jgi:hypothetical protein
MGGAKLGAMFESGAISYHDKSGAHEANCPDGSVLVGFRNDGLDWFHYRCRWPLAAILMPSLATALTADQPVRFDFEAK